MASSSDKMARMKVMSGKLLFLQTHTAIDSVGSRSSVALLLPDVHLFNVGSGNGLFRTRR